MDPGFLRRTLAQLPLGVVLVSGTNGKTTTTRMVSMMLESLGLRVFTNPTGSNFTRGVVSALLQEVSAGGALDADIAVLELDEAYAVHFVEQVRPDYALLLNVMRDQLDRFGEIDNTARLLSRVAARWSPTPVSITSATVPAAGSAAGTAGAASRSNVVAMSSSVGKNRRRACDRPKCTVRVPLGTTCASAAMRGSSRLSTTVPVVAAATRQASVRTPQAIRERAARLPAKRRDGFVMRAQRFAGASTDALVDALAQVTPAFGRGEVIDVQGSPVELLLVKNPMGFRLALASFPPADCNTMICINDEYADGRDMSWLWDVDFTSLHATGVDAVSGVRAWDMALRLEYDGVAARGVNTDLEQPAPRAPRRARPPRCTGCRHLRGAPRSRIRCRR